jgi:hypothetical protein
MFGKYFKTVYRAFNTPPVSLIWGLNGMYAAAFKAIKSYRSSASKVKKCTKCIIPPVGYQHTLLQTLLYLSFFASSFIIAWLS